MSQEEILERLKNAVLVMDAEAAKATANDALSKNIDPLTCIDQGLSEGMKVISDKFDNAEIYVPQIILSAEAFTDAVNILAPHIQGGYSAKGKLIVHMCLLTKSGNAKTIEYNTRKSWLNPIVTQ